MCKRLITIAKIMGCKDVQLIDIGGGFPGEKGTEIDKVYSFCMLLYAFFGSFHVMHNLYNKNVFNQSFEIFQLANLINDAIQNLDPSIKIISEPGRYYVTSAFTLATYLYSKRLSHKNGKITRMYYINVGTYNSFIEKLMGLKSRVPQILFEVITFSF